MPASPTFTETWGCQMIAYMINTALYGVASLLMGQYFYGHSQNDSKRVRIIVGLLWTFGTAQIVFLSHQVYTDYVTRFSQFELLDNIVLDSTSWFLWPSLPFDLGFIQAQLLAVRLQLKFSLRFGSGHVSNFLLKDETKDIDREIKSGASSKEKSSTQLLLAFLQIGFGIAQTVLSIKTAKFSLLSSTTRITSTQAGATAVCDVTITIALWSLLSRAKSGIRRTDSALDKLILYSINRGAATSFCAAMNLICFVSLPGTFIFLIFLDMSSQLYLISVASMLLSRKSIREKMSNQIITDSSFPLESLRTAQSTAIHIQRDVVTWDDHNPDMLEQGPSESKDKPLTK
ncbi:hypothetical protein BDP27DRAFT_1429854 [Rhodocollybia butyracea]|uniref:DUF6534 domain-containing protein n=1 Tax=Rhodocollybia butyracea TaxID=206335 RepID=A0A9P5P822_9AGAR|nr:hypothetical protein BDP27DRAFT_1429854 [Rhodocollybia butyracea]